MSASPPGYPFDGKPRFKATDVNVLDRANCHRIVASFESSAPATDGRPSGVHVKQDAPDLARREAARLNAIDATGEPFTPMPKSVTGRPLSTKCIRGHEWTPENTYQHPFGRQCRACRRLRHTK